MVGKPPWDGGPLMINPIYSYTLYSGYLLGISPSIFPMTPENLHPPKQTWNLKMDPWKRRFLLETIISRFHVNFWGCIITIIHMKPAVAPPNITLKSSAFPDRDVVGVVAALEPGGFGASAKMKQKPLPSWWLNHPFEKY